MNCCDVVGYVCDGEIVCPECFEGDENDPEIGAVFADSESDSPDHCAYCHRPIENDLTSDGVEYVVERIEEDLRRGVAHGRAFTWPDGYYKDSDGNAVTRDWCEKALPYLRGPEHARERRILELFLFWTRPDRAAA